MIRPVLTFFALAAVAAPAAAATYSAKLAVPTTGFIARDISWACGADACRGATEQSRPAVLCQSLARRAGKVDSFQVDGRAFGAAELEKCNAAAKTRPGQAIAAH